jgi:hypothetical protein
MSNPSPFQLVWPKVVLSDGAHTGTVVRAGFLRDAHALLEKRFGTPMHPLFLAPGRSEPETIDKGAQIKEIGCPD